MTNERDPRSDLGAWLGEELRNARQDAGYSSQDALARKLTLDRTTITKAETGSAPPSDAVATLLQQTFPELANGLYVQLCGIARRGNGKFARWFERDWLPIEREAASLRWWENTILPGLLQTPDYARALTQAWDPTASEDAIEALVSGKVERQAILDSDDPPDLRVVVAESVLRNLVGSASVMHAQLIHLAEMSRRPAISVQVLPADIGANGGMLGAFTIASNPDAVYLETAIEAQVTGDGELIGRAALVFDRLRDDALPRGASRDFIQKVAGTEWNT